MESRGLRAFDRLVSAFLCLLVVSAAGAAQTAPSFSIRSGCELDYPPFCIVHDDGTADGFSVELLVAVLEKMGRTVTLRTGPWVEVRGWLERGEIDALPLVGRTPERESLFDFTVPYLTMHGAIVVRRDTTGVHALEDLRGRTVAVMQGDNAEEFLRREPREFEMVTLPTYADAFRLLAEGGCDAVVIQRLVAARLIDELRLSSVVRIVDQPILGFSQEFCLAVTEGDHALLSVLNEGLALAMADGTHRRLYAKWFAHLELPSDRAIIVGGDANYPPFEYLDEDGRPVGYNVDLIHAVAQAAGLTIDIRLGPWSEMTQALEDGEIDAMQGMLYSTERDGSFDFSQAHIVNHCVAVVRKGGGSPPSTVEDLVGKRIVVQDGDIMHAFAVEHGLEEGLTTVNAQEDALRELAAGHFDCALVARITALYWIDLNGWRNLEVGRTPLLSPEYCFAVPEGSRALLAELSEGLAAVKQAGEYQRIYERWMGVYDPNLVAQRTLKYAGIIAGALLIAVVMVLVWSWSLRRQVKLRTDQLRESTAFQRAMVGCSPVALYSIDRDGNVLTWNESAERIFGWGEEETIGRALPIVPDNGQDELAALREQVQAGESFTGKELKRQRRDGSQIDVRLSAAPVRDEQGRIVAILSAAEDVTERKRVERTVDRQRAMLARTERIAHIGSWEWDADTDTVLWSEEMFRLLGRDPAAGAPSLAEHDQFFDPEDMGCLRAAVARAVEDGTSYEMELRSSGGDGRAKTFVVRGYADMEHGKPITRLFGSFQDITERKQAEWRIDHLNRVLRAIRDVNQLITHETDREALLQRSCEILISTRGYHSAWVALHAEEGDVSLVAESGIGEDFAAVRDALTQGEWPPCCVVARERSGGIAVIHNTHTNCTACSLSRAYRETAALAGELRFGDHAYGVLVIALPTQLADDAEEQSLFKELVGDIAYALHAMDLKTQHGKAEAALRESEGKYRSLFDQSTEAIYLHDLDGRILDVNEAACAQSRYSREEWLGLTVFDGHARTSTTNLPKAAILHAWREWEPGQQHVFEAEHQRKDGTVYPVEVSTGIVRYGETKRVLAIVKDITERHRLDTQLRQAQKMESIGRLAGGVAHDFNNLLMGIMNYADLCRDSIAPNHPSRKWLDEITREAERSASLTRQLLAFARRQTVAPQVVELNDAVGDILEMLRRLIGENIDLVWEPAAELWPVEIDPSQLDQILANLFVNARDAIGESSGKLTVETQNVAFRDDYCAQHAEATPGEYVMLAVSDDGRGMDAETLEHAFEPFFTTKNAGEGTGLGLATVYGIVKQGGGFVNVYSEPGHGTTFRIYLPRVDGVSGPTARTTDELSRHPGGDETILLVEDEASIRETVGILLRRLGYTLLSAENPEAARRAAADQHGPIDLLITDVVMPGMNGRDLAENLLANDPAMKVLYMSGYTANIIAHRGILDEGVHFLSKPISSNNLARAVRQLLDDR